MLAIHRKLLRELWHLRWQALAIAMVMACGVAIVVMALSTLDSLSNTRDAYYERTLFAQVFARLKRAPLAIADRVRQIPGVAKVDTRVVVSVTLDVEGMSEPATALIISIPEHGQPALNRLHLRAGRWIEPGRADEILVAEAFAQAHDMQPGDSLEAVINGRYQRLRCVGVVLSPEYIYSVRPGELLPDDKRFGVLWMGYEALANAYDLDGSFNDLALTLVPGASQPEVIRRVDRLLDDYGGHGAFDREQQPSYRFLNNEMIQLGTMAVLPPTIFLGVTAFLLQVVMSRLIATQREEIATMRAFGYRRHEMALHYLQFAGVIICVGAILGILLGAWFGYNLTQMYTKFFHFPEFRYHLQTRVVAIAFTASATATLLGTLSTVWRAASKPPAQAMQPEPPTSYRRTILEHLGLARFLSPGTRMILRHLERQPARSALSCLGIALAIGILIMGNFMNDTVNYVMDFQFALSQRQAMMVTFVEPLSGRALHDLQHLPGVVRVEPFRSIPVRLKHGPRSRRLAIMGLPTDASLFRVFDAHENQLVMPEKGIVISTALAKLLDLRVGESLEMEVLEGFRPARAVPVVGLVDDFMDLNAYMEIGEMQRLMREEQSVSGAFLAIDSAQVDELYAKLKETPRVAGVTIKQAMLANFRKTLAENLLRMRTINVLFASVVAFGVVYNCARISLSERARELATLRVLGFTRRETSFILLGELAVLVALAIPLGMGIGYSLAYLLVSDLATEVHRFPLVIRPATYAFAISVTLTASIVSALVVRQRIDSFDLVAVLKARD